MVSAQNFLTAFNDQWNHDLENNQQELLNAYPQAPTWTAYMLKGDNAFLRRVAGCLDRDMVVERDRIDASYYNTDTEAVRDLYPDWWQAYPARWDVLIEHENGNYPEEELYKLLMRRAPLKVVIFYDWPTFRLNYQQWLPDKLRELFRIGRTVTAAWLEAENTEYLFLIGRTINQGQPPTWQYLVVQDGCWPEQPGEPQALLGLVA